ncbi:hypothetical protein ACE418_12655 [Megasphaera sp. WILCCON 0056]|uniref:hypothetical protein n=1 Tax=Megasphaera sp. WILCCON 0056 TaxID=3345340 RepID=UPI003A80DC42
MKEACKEEAAVNASAAFDRGIYLNSLHLSIYEYSRLCEIVAKQANAGNTDTFLYGASVVCSLSVNNYPKRHNLLDMCYTIADTVHVPKGMFYVFECMTGKRYKAALTRDGAMKNWQDGQLQ